MNLYTIRPIVEQDMPFLWDMLYESLYVPVGQEAFSREVIKEPFINEDNKGYGYISNDTPELEMSLIKEYRGQGIGTALLRKLFEKMTELGIKRISLSVDPGNLVGVKLYQRFGFKEVGMEGTSITMIADLKRM